MRRNNRDMKQAVRHMKESESGRIVVDRMEIADSLWRQTVGLLGRDSLDTDAGLWLEPCNGVHTIGMRFAIDLMFLNRDGVALKLFQNVPPSRIVGIYLRARVVVELPAGTLSRQKIESGNRYFLE